MASNGLGPIQLPYSKIGVSMEAEQNSGGACRISHHKAGKSLPIYRVVRNASGFGRGVEQTGWLKQDSLL
jgi:hypothetical protein